MAEGELDPFGRPRREEGGWLPPVAPGGSAPTETPPAETATPGWAPPAQADTTQRWRTDPAAIPVPPADPVRMGKDELAPFGARAGAATIDFLIRLGAVAVGAGLGAILFVAGETAGVVGAIAGAGLGYVLGSFVYAPVMIARTNGRTVGHRVSGTRIVRVDGTPMTGGKAFLREVLVKGVLMEGVGSFIFGLLTLVNYLLPLFDEHNEALHDKVCGTRVVQDRDA